MKKVKKRIAVCLHGHIRTFASTYKWIQRTYRNYDVDYYCLINDGDPDAEEGLKIINEHFKPVVIKTRTIPSGVMFPIMTFNIVAAMALFYEYSAKNNIRYDAVVVTRYDVITGPNWDSFGYLTFEHPDMVYTAEVINEKILGEGIHATYADTYLAFDHFGAVNFATAGIQCLGEHPYNHDLLFAHSGIDYIFQKTRLTIKSSFNIYDELLIRKEHTSLMPDIYSTRDNWQQLKAVSRKLVGK